VTEANLAYPTDIASDIDEYTRNLALALATEPAQAFCFLALDDATPLGFILYEVQHRLLGHPKRFAFVHYAFTVPAHRGEGVMDALCELGCEHALAQGLEWVELTHLPTNTHWTRLGLSSYEARSQGRIAGCLAALDHVRARRAVAAETRGNGHDVPPPLDVPRVNEED